MTGVIATRRTFAIVMPGRAVVLLDIDCASSRVAGEAAVVHCLSGTPGAANGIEVPVEPDDHTHGAIRVGRPGHKRRPRSKRVLCTGAALADLGPSFRTRNPDLGGSAGHRRRFGGLFEVVTRAVGR
jgi:hypothetical protein